MYDYIYFTMTESFDYLDREPRFRSALSELAAQINRAESKYDLHEALNSYLIDEYDMPIGPSTEAEYIKTAGELYLPPDDIYDSDIEEAKDYVKIATFKTIVPLYEELHEPEEVRRWLSSLYNLMVADNNRHHPDQCGVTSLAKDYEPCAIGSCPPRHAISYLLNRMEEKRYAMMFGGYIQQVGYEADDKVYSNFSSHIESMVHTEIISSELGSELGRRASLVSDRSASYIRFVQDKDRQGRRYGV